MKSILVSLILIGFLSSAVFGELHSWDTITDSESLSMFYSNSLGTGGSETIKYAGSDSGSGSSAKTSADEIAKKLANPNTPLQVLL